MVKKQEPQTPHEPEARGTEAMDALVARHVLLALGRPPDMLRIQVRCLWAAFYRVNVFVGGDNASAKILNSYFVRASPEGQVLEAQPPLARKYGAAKPGGVVVSEA